MELAHLEGRFVVARKNENASKRQLVADAIAAAVDGRWEDALKANDSLLARFPHDADALNRKGRALIELRQLNAARDAYTESLKADPANMIARRNLQRLEKLYNRPEGSLEGTTPANTVLPRQNTFIEETGKTWVDELVNPADESRLYEVSPGEQLVIVVEDNKVFVDTNNGVRLGEVGAPIGQRIADLIGGGNRYEVHALGISGQSLRVIIREVFQDPSQINLISFPEQVRKTQELMRERELLFQREEGDFVFGEEEDDDLEDEEEAESEPDHEDDDVTDASEYVGDAVVNDDDEREEM
jgi:tetratricopeptide (TPR) repeat protein